MEKSSVAPLRQFHEFADVQSHDYLIASNRNDFDRRFTNRRHVASDHVRSPYVVVIGPLRIDMVRASPTEPDKLPQALAFDALDEPIAAAISVSTFSVLLSW